MQDTRCHRLYSKGGGPGKAEEEEMLRALGLTLLMAYLPSCSGEPPETLGLRNGRLAPCPDKPNCLCSDDGRKGHFAEPLAFTGPPGEAWARLRGVIENYPRTKIVTDTGDYMHSEFTVSIFGFVDDVEFHLRPDQGIIAVRSASRLGYSDLGVNRRRLDRIRRMLKDLGPI